MKNLYLTLLIMLTVVFTSSCQKDSDLLAEILISEEPIAEIDLQDAILLPSDFDWSNIPADFSDSIWEITEDYDLGGLTITLPPNVTLYFNGGSLLNGTLTGDKTVIISKTQTQVFQGLNLAGNFKTEYLKPYWFGAVMDGVTDDRDAFVETLEQSNNIQAKVIVEKDIFIDSDDTNKPAVKSIFLEDNTWIEGKNDVNIVVNNLHSPVFYMVHTKNITIKNIILLWDSKYDPTWDYDSNINAANVQRLEDCLTKKHNVIFNSSNPIWRSSRALYTIFSLHAPENILFENVTFKAKGETPDKFIRWAIKLREEFSPNQTIINNTGITSVPRNIALTNVVMDGVLMGIQGIVDGFKSDGLKSYRYSDMQGSNGENLGGDLGGGKYNFPPPHLIYLNDDSSKAFHLQNVEILNTIDYGEYVGSPNTRTTISGYCASLVITGNSNNIFLNNYKSYRRDGFLGMHDMTNGVFKNIYSEYDSSIFDPAFGFNNIRFTGSSVNNVVFENIILKDVAKVSEIYPLKNPTGNYITMDNLNIYVNELGTDISGCFGINGSNNTIKNSSLVINKHTSTKEYVGVVTHTDSIRDTGSNNNYDIKVEGWRNIDNNPSGKSIRMLFASSSNTNTNYAKVTDTNNNFVIEQKNNIQNDTWNRKEVVTLSGGTSHLLTLTIPNGFTVSKISANTLENFASGITVSLGTSSTQKDNLLSNVSKTTGTVSKTINELTAETGNREIYLFANGDFQNKGKIEVTLELKRVSQYN